MKQSSVLVVRHQVLSHLAIKVLLIKSSVVLKKTGVNGSVLKMLLHLHLILTHLANRLIVAEKHILIHCIINRWHVHEGRSIIGNDVEGIMRWHEIVDEVETSIIAIRRWHEAVDEV